MSRTKWVGIALIACAATGVAVAHAATERTRPAVAAKQVKQTKLAQATRVTTPARAAVGNAQGTFTIVFSEPALASYRGEIKGYAKPSTRAGKAGARRLDAKGAASLRYVDFLKERQATQLASIESRIGRAVAVRSTMQHALNAVVVELTSAEAAQVAKQPGVRLVEAYKEFALDTDNGPALIGAPAVWSGDAGAAPYQGEGVVFGILDTGVNYGSPSFAGTDPVTGFVHTNPLGAGTYLGECLAGGANEGDCNTKLIGGYDFVCGEPANQCGVANIREEPGFGDTNNHGSHVGSTTSGNFRDVQYFGVNRRMSGVAPRSNVVAFDICYTNTATGQGSCPTVSSTAAINQAVEDGAVDVINYSIGGGTSPWSDSVSLAFLSAVDSGIYVAASAGNSGPNANTGGHLQPWVATTAAAQHGRGDFVFLAEVTGPGTVPEALQAIAVNPGQGGVTFSAAIPDSTPLTISPTYGDPAGDLCTAPTAGVFSGQIVVASRGTCSFTIKTQNATVGGAVAILIANNAAGGLLPSVPDTTIPAFGILQADGNALRDFRAANATATLGVGYPATMLPNRPDQLAAFSSRGPASTINTIKPDITGPGVSILAAVAGTTVEGFEQAIGLLSGTSMSSPHHAGAAGLVRQARPTWTAPEIKSALMMTATPTVIDSNGTTRATPFGQGAGRVQVDRAINSPLVLDETTANFQAANPATGGNVSALNLASMQNRACGTTCTFTRTFRNTTGTAQTWTTRLTGVTGTASPAQLTVAAGASASVTVTVNAASIPTTGVFSFGSLTLKPYRPARGQSLETLSLPIAIARQP